MFGSKLVALDERLQSNRTANLRHVEAQVGHGFQALPIRLAEQAKHHLSQSEVSNLVNGKGSEFTNYRERGKCASVIVLFALMPYRQDHDLRSADDLEQRDIPCAAERNDQLPLRRVTGGLAKAEWRHGQPVLRGRSDRVDRGLRVIKVFTCLGAVEQEIKEPRQVGLSRR